MKERDLELWKIWKQNPTSANLQNLLNALAPLIRYESNKYQQTGLSASVLEGKAKEIAYEAILSYNPAHSQLNTHVVNHMKRLNRYTIENQNAVRPKETDVFMYRKYLKAQEELTDLLGREPTEVELRSKLGIGFKLKDLLKPTSEHMYSINVEGGGEAPTRDDLSYENVAMRMTYNNLTGKRKDIMGMAFGIDRKKVKPSDIATKLKISKPAVSKHLRAIEDKYRKYNHSTSFLIG